jgi:hypothetical protein
MRLSRLVLLLFLTAQLWDGIFTWVAVDVHGLAAEGNLILATWMALAGPTPVLVAAKVGAAAGGVLLYTRGVHGVLMGLTVFYAIAAIGPWLAHYSVL